MRCAVAYINWGRWVADCPHDGCTNAFEVTPGQQEFVCGWAGHPSVPGCRGTASLEWPDDPAAVMAGLHGNPEPRQNWRPPVDDPQECA